MRFAIYQLSTGIIERTVDVPEFLLDANTPEACSAILVNDSVTDEFSHVDLSATPHDIVAKTRINFAADKASIVADGLDTLTVSGLPVPTTIIPPEGDAITVTDGHLEIAIDLPGVWEFKATSPLYLQTTIEVIAE